MIIVLFSQSQKQLVWNRLNSWAPYGPYNAKGNRFSPLQKAKKRLNIPNKYNYLIKNNIHFLWLKILWKFKFFSEIISELLPNIECNALMCIIQNKYKYGIVKSYLEFSLL